jgi:MFS transporter, PAT family, beta-lactamase induction signal transducer AmpG
MENMDKLFQALFNQRIRIVLILGFASGLPLALSGSTLQAWYAISNVDITTIGFLSLIGQPYVFKFLWAPFLDRYTPQLFKQHLTGRRRGWILLSQIVLASVIALMSLLSPEKAPLLLAFLALMLAFSSATQDIAIDAYRTDILKPSERGLGAALSVGGYRVAMLVSGGLVLILADHLGWHIALLLMAGLMIISAIITFFAPEPIYDQPAPITLKAAIKEPFIEFISRTSLNQNSRTTNNLLHNKAILFLLLIVIYKMGDAFAGTLTTTFLIRGANFSLTDIGLVMKSVGLFATLFGVFLGGLVLYRKGLYFSLMWFGIFQALTNLGFVLLSMAGKSYFLMVAVIGMENLAGGMGTAAFVAFLMGLCNHRYSATQFALFSALSAVARVYVGPMAGYGVEWLDWSWFFLVTFFIALPGLVLLAYLRRNVEDLDRNLED